MEKRVREIFRSEDVRFWIFMNVVIIAVVPFLVAIIRWAAESPISLSSLTTDFTLAAFSILFNIGAYIIGEIPQENPPQDSAGILQNKLAEKLVASLIRESRNKLPNKLSEELGEKLKEIFCKYLTVSSLKKKKGALEKQQIAERKEHTKRLEEDKRLKRYGIGAFFCAALCGIVYGIESEGKFDTAFLIIHIIVVIALLIICARCGTITLVTMKTRKRHEREEV